MRAVAILLIVSVALSGCFDELIQGFRGQQPVADLLGDDPSEWIIEVDYEPGALPSDLALGNLLSTLRDITDKSSIRLIDSDASIEAPADTDALIEYAREEIRDFGPRGDRAVTQLIFVNTPMEDSEDRRLALALGRELVVVYSERIREQCDQRFIDLGPLRELFPANCNEDEIFTAALVHEFGHILGLVDNGAEMVVEREDSEHPTHSTNQDSVMYWAITTSFIQEAQRKFNEGDVQGAIDALNYEVPTTFDVNDLRDLCNAGSQKACEKVDEA